MQSELRHPDRSAAQTASLAFAKQLSCPVPEPLRPATAATCLRGLPERHYDAVASYPPLFICSGPSCRARGAGGRLRDCRRCRCS